MVVARVIVSRLKIKVAGCVGGSWDKVHSGFVKRVVGSGFDIKGRGGMGTGLPESNLKVEDVEAAAQKFQAATSIGFLSSTLRFENF